MKLFLLCGAAALTAVAARAEVVMPDIFSDNMVLQQQSDVRIWGWCTPGASVVVNPGWSEVSYSATAGKDGRWDVAVATPEASYTPWTVTVSGDASEIRLENVLVGEVWLCSGQSNMEMPLNGFWCQPVENAGKAIAYAGRYPGVRVATVERKGDYEPQTRAAGKWLESKPENAGGFSAVAYFFARSLNDILGVPVGVINCSLGGSKVEGWMPKWKLDEYPDCDVEKEKATPDSVLHLWERINIMYNAMLNPIKGYTVKGFLWNQGEANVGAHLQYPQRLADMVKIWRDEWNQGQLPFYYVEIPAWSYGNPDGSIAALLREAQHKAADMIPNSGFVSTTDLIYPYEIDDIHGSKKEEIGERLAFMASARTYGVKGMPDGYPCYKSVELSGNRAVIHLDNITNGLTPNGELEGFEVAGADRRFYPAKARELRYCRAIEVSSDDVADIRAVRYCFRNFSIGCVHNLVGLPLVPFRTDDWAE